MKHVVLDSCVFSKQFLDESDSPQARTLIEQLVKHKVQILVPHLFIYEVLATLNTAQYPISDGYQIIGVLQKSNVLKVVELNNAYLNIISNICQSGHIKSGFPSFYDASYHALAVLYDCYFVTADKRHFVKTSQLGNIVLLHDWETIF